MTIKRYDFAAYAMGDKADKRTGSRIYVDADGYQAAWIQAALQDYSLYGIKLDKLELITEYEVGGTDE